MKEQLAIVGEKLEKCSEQCHAWRERALAREERVVEKAVLVYQAGFANVFAVKSFNMADYGCKRGIIGCRENSETRLEIFHGRLLLTRRSKTLKAEGNSSAYFLFYLEKRVDKLTGKV